MRTRGTNTFEAAYAGVVGRLLSIGEGKAFKPDSWPDYPLQFHLNDENIPDLIRMMADDHLYGLSLKRPEVWAPVHAWRALGQLRALAAIEPLIQLLVDKPDDDFVASELPTVFGMIGPAAIPHLAAFIDALSQEDMAVMTAAGALAEIGKSNPYTRMDCIAVLAKALKHVPTRETFINGSIVASLMDLSAVEAIEDIRDAFKRDIVDPTVAGDLEDVEIDLGLRQTRVTPKPFYPLFPGHEPGFLPRLNKPAVSDKIGRNEPCPCGSGKKYKKCCYS